MKNKLIKLFNVKCDNKKFNKIVKITLISLLIVLFIILIGFGIKNYNDERLVKEELTIIDRLNASIDTINMEIKAKGDYGKVEQAMKEYYQDYFNKKKIFNNNRVEAIFNTLTVDYLKENKSKLKKLNLKKTIDTKTSELNEAVNGIVDMLNSDNIMAYVHKYNLHSYYNSFYRDIMVSNNDGKIQKEWQDLMEKNSVKAGYLKEIIDILVNNTSSWYVKDDTLYFSSDALLEEYNKLHGLIYEDINLDNEISDISL